MAKYHCKYCKKTVERKSDKAWIKSWCKTAGKYTMLMLITSRFLIRKGDVL